MAKEISEDWPAGSFRGLYDDLPKDDDAVNKLERLIEVYTERSRSPVLTFKQQEFCKHMADEVRRLIAIITREPTA